jgi:5'-3' exonuclease
MAQLKALVGGKDNLPGVKGVGKKYGAVLLNHYGSLTNVLRAALSESDDWPLSPRVRALVAAAAADVLVFYKIARVRVDLDVEYIEPLADQRMVVEMLRTYRFQSLVAPAELHALMKLGRD